MGPHYDEVRPGALSNLQDRIHRNAHKEPMFGRDSILVSKTSDPAQCKQGFGFQRLQGAPRGRRPPFETGRRFDDMQEDETALQDRSELESIRKRPPGRL